jgi:hypothetical protein
MYQAVLQRTADENRYSRLTFLLEPTDRLTLLVATLANPVYNWHGDVTIYKLGYNKMVAKLKENSNVFSLYL